MIARKEDGGYRHLYGGMERLDEITGVGGGSYDFGARIYDARLGRWLAVDPLFAKFPSESPYNFALNNPNYFIDEDGQEPISAAIEALSSFAISVGMDFFTAYLLEDKNVGESLSNVGWFSATIDAGITFGLSLAGAKGVGMSRKVVKFANSKIGKVTSKTVTNIVTNFERNLQQGKYNNEDGEFDKSKLFNVQELTTLFGEAAVEALLEQGLGDAALNLVKKLKMDNLPADLLERYNRLNEKDRSGLPFTKAGKENVKDIDEYINFGQTKCKDCGVNTLPATQNQRGVTPDWRETNVDHRNPMRPSNPNSTPGRGNPDNGEIRCRGCNIEKSND